MNYANSAQMFSQARRNLMLPHFRGTAYSISLAFQNASEALFRVNPESLDETAREWITELNRHLDMTGIEDQGDGLGLAKAQGMNNDERLDFSRLIDELANWFLREAIRRE